MRAFGESEAASVALVSKPYRYSNGSGINYNSSANGISSTFCYLGLNTVLCNVGKTIRFSLFTHFLVLFRQTMPFGHFPKHALIWAHEILAVTHQFRVILIHKNFQTAIHNNPKSYFFLKWIVFSNLHFEKNSRAAKKQIVTCFKCRHAFLE